MEELIALIELAEPVEPIEPVAPVEEPVAPEPELLRLDDKPAPNDEPENLDRKVCVDAGSVITEGYVLAENGEGRGALLTPGVVVP